jgi:Rieske Fe-S protein
MAQDTPSVPRRRFLTICAKATATLVGIAAAAVGVDYFFPSLRRRLGRSNAPFLAVCAVESIPSGKWHLVNFDSIEGEGPKAVKHPHSVWVRREAGGGGVDSIRVLSPICPHKGCEVEWRADQTAFVCPCHRGTFHVNGQYKSGPPRRSMDPLEFHVEQGQLFVQWLG